MAKRKKTIRHDEIVALFGQRLRERRLERGMSQAELAHQAEVTTNYVSRLEGGGAAPGIDLVARLATSLGVTVADLVPMPAPPKKELSVLREQAQRLFDLLLQTEDRAVLSILTQLLSRLSEATNR
jgi:transcriptional regulator with XRE-family HTH domain